jgi:hypothetical protein
MAHTDETANPMPKKKILETGYIKTGKCISFKYRSLTH